MNALPSIEAKLDRIMKALERLCDLLERGMKE
jgi:hypothetical protein